MSEKQHEYWRCPSCYHRYWTLHGRAKLICPGENCRTRCIPISFASYKLPDNGRTLATAWICVDRPSETYD